MKKKKKNVRQTTLDDITPRATVGNDLNCFPNIDTLPGSAAFLTHGMNIA